MKTRFLIVTLVAVVVLAGTVGTAYAVPTTAIGSFPNGEKVITAVNSDGVGTYAVTLNWPPASAGATGYIVEVYQGKEFVTEQITGANDCTFGGLTPGRYTFYVYSTVYDGGLSLLDMLKVNVKIR